jgi:hypothetical protein
MLGSSHLFGGFSISPSLARRMFEVVEEMHARELNLSLSHVDDDNCEICRKIKEQKEKPHDAAQPDRPGHRWTA